MIKLTPDSGLQELKKAFDENQERAINEVYRLHRDSFLRYCLTWSAPSNDHLDCFQEAVIALYENLVNGKIKTDQSNLKTYLFTIGKHKVIDEIDRKKRRDKRNELQKEVDDAGSMGIDEDSKLALRSKIAQLGDSCKKLLIKYYFHQYTIESIMIDMDYKNQNTVKAHKSRCMKKLKELIRKTSDK